MRANAFTPSGPKVVFGILLMGFLVFATVLLAGCSQPEPGTVSTEAEARLQLYVDEALQEYEGRVLEIVDTQTKRMTLLMQEDADRDSERLQDIIDADALYYEEQFLLVGESIRDEAEGAVAWFESLEERMALLEDPDTILRAKGLSIVDDAGRMRIRLGLTDGGFAVLSFHSDGEWGDRNSSLYSSVAGTDLYLNTDDLTLCMMLGGFAPCALDEEGYLVFTDE